MCWWRLIVVEVAPKNFSTVASFFTCQRQTYREAIFTPEADQMVDGRKKFRRNAKKIKSGPRMNKYFLLLSDPQLSQKKNKTLLCWSRCCFFLLFILLNEFLLDQQWARLTTQKLYIHQKKNNYVGKVRDIASCSLTYEISSGKDSRRSSRKCLRVCFPSRQSCWLKTLNNRLNSFFFGFIFVSLGSIQRRVALYNHHTHKPLRNLRTAPKCQKWNEIFFCLSFPS